MFFFPHTFAIYSDTLEEKCSRVPLLEGEETTTAIADDVKRTWTREERATTISPHNRTAAEKGGGAEAARPRVAEEFLPRSELTTALDIAIPSSRFGILRSHSSKMVRDNGAL